MKSIICEASSIAKAIEQGWKKAGLPQNFSVKILEKEEKNFIGLTKKPAKIALFFENKPELQKKRIDQRSNSFDKLKYEKDKSLQENLKSLQDSPQKGIQKKQTPAKPVAKTQSQPVAQVRVFPQASKPMPEATAKTQPVKTQVTPAQTQAQAQTNMQDAEKAARKSPWTEQMVASSSQWVQDMLNKMNLMDVKFSVTVSYNNIRFHFEKSLIENKNEQKELFRNLAFLLMQTTRYKYKKQFRNLKAVFTSNI